MRLVAALPRAPRFKLSISTFTFTQSPLISIQNFKPRTISTKTTIMATPSKIHLTLKETGVVHSQAPTEESAAKTSQLLQENHAAGTLHFSIQDSGLTRDQDTPHLLQR